MLVLLEQCFHPLLDATSKILCILNIVDIDEILSVHHNGWHSLYTYFARHLIHPSFLSNHCLLSPPLIKICLWTAHLLKDVSDATQVAEFLFGSEEDQAESSSGSIVAPEPRRKRTLSMHEDDSSRSSLNPSQHDSAASCRFRAEGASPLRDSEGQSAGSGNLQGSQQ